jgi:hypothetical protein
LSGARPRNDKDGLELHLVLSVHGLVGKGCKPHVDGSTAVTIKLPTGWDVGRSTSVLCARTRAKSPFKANYNDTTGVAALAVEAGAVVQ